MHNENTLTMYNLYFSFFYIIIIFYLNFFKIYLFVILFYHARFFLFLFLFLFTFSRLKHVKKCFIFLISLLLYFWEPKVRERKCCLVQFFQTKLCKKTVFHDLHMHLVKTSYEKISCTLAVF